MCITVCIMFIVMSVVHWFIFSCSNFKFGKCVFVCPSVLTTGHTKQKWGVCYCVEIIYYMYKKYLKIICIFKLFKILFKGLDTFMFVTHVEGKISHWDCIESLSLLMLSFIYLINHLSFFIFFLNKTKFSIIFLCPNIKL